MSPSLTVGIASIGEMGAGIAKLLIAHQYRVLANVSDRSEATRQRARAAGIETVESHQALFDQADYILSIVPPRDALSTARHFKPASRTSTSPREQKLCYVDLNAVSPTSALVMAENLAPTSIRFLDGGIIGGPPKLQPDGTWSRPSLVVSGPSKVDEALAETLNISHVADTIGPASGLKMCFASMTKGLTAISIQSFATAHRLGMLDHLQSHLQQYSPKTGDLAAKGLVGMPPKAYRWVDEMKEIAETFRKDGGFDEDVFTGVSNIYRFVAEQTELGVEKTGDRNAGKTPDDVARLVAEGLIKRR